jgi:hypothetical protein
MNSEKNFSLQHITITFFPVSHRIHIKSCCNEWCSKGGIFPQSWKICFCTQHTPLPREWNEMLKVSYCKQRSCKRTPRGGKIFLFSSFFCLIVFLVLYSQSLSLVLLKAHTCTMNFNFTLHFVPTYFQFNHKNLFEVILHLTIHSLIRHSLR